MTEVIYKFPSALQKAYTSVHVEISDLDDVKGYQNLSSTENNEFLDKSTFKYAAAQFHRYFPAHYFKARYLLDNMIEERTLNSWVDNNSRLVLIDAGCGAGAASAAYIEKLSEICQTRPEKLSLYCIAFDPDQYAIALYNKLIKNLVSEMRCPNLIVEFRPLHIGIPSLKPLIDLLELKRKEWNIPRIPNALLLRMNIDRPLSKRYYEKKQQEEFFKTHDIPIVDDVNYGDEEADTYEAMLRNASIDRLNIIAIATQGFDASGKKNSSEFTLQQRLKEFSESLSHIAEKNGHIHSRIECSTYVTQFINAESSYYETNRQAVPIHYFATANFISDKSLVEDLRWEKILSLSNLQLAWARARRNLLQEALYDEVEIRLFEDQLERNLSNLTNRLANYVNSIFTDDQIIAFKTLKASGNKRPRGLSRLEEEILFSAVIQDVSSEYAGRYPSSYAYQIKVGRAMSNEYLYSDWFEAYNKYVKDAIEAAIKYATTGAVIKTDISKFYEKIIQGRLLEITSDELYKYSARIEWFLRSLIDREHFEHDVGKGLSQGSIGSGFFANVYLSPLHRFFQDMEVEFFRYVDDMIIVAKDADDVDMILEKLAEFIDKELGLELNFDKTRVYYDIDEFLEDMNRNSDLNDYHQKHQGFLNLLWYGDSNFRSSLKNAYSDDDSWWGYLKVYQKCLAEMSIFIDLQTLSRRTRLNLFNEENIARHLKELSPLTIPQLPDPITTKKIKAWVKEFRDLNLNFIIELDHHRQRIYNLFINTYKSIDLNNIDKKDASKLRFAINKLSTLGLGKIRKELLEVVINAPWLLEVSYTFENMALNGFDLPPMTRPERVRVELVLQKQPEADSLSCCADDDDCTPDAIVQ